jgi:hypothetical protein
MTIMKKRNRSHSSPKDGMSEGSISPISIGSRIKDKTGMHEEA